MISDDFRSSATLLQPSKQPLIQFNEVTISRNGHFPILNQCAFELLPCEKIGLIGGNGSGKTTLLWLVVGLLLPQSGTIEILGKIRRTEHDFQEIRGKVGLLFQDSDDQLFCTTVYDDIAFGPLNQGKKRHDVQRIVDDTLMTIGMSGFQHQVTHHLSGGEKRLIALGTILAMLPRVLLLDEPDSDLDEQALHRLTDIIKQCNQGMVIVSHNHEFLDSVCTKIMRLDQGKLIFVHDCSGDKN